ncbi:MAG: hypothetical protein J7L26_04455 [Candidatus Aminicenantes bacterium]|nr:hypothetical protein [Candidatus Aminicenantes bacterium]
MKIEIFSLERTQSLWEHTVKYNLTDSGVHPLSLRELLSPEEIDELLALELGYSQTNGSLELRQAITGLYPGSGPDNILVTNGTAEAISLNNNLQFLNEWLARYPELFSLTLPQAGGMAFIKYHFSMNSTELITRLRETKSVFLAPGNCFGLDGFFRLGLGADPTLLQPGLQLFGEWLKENILT